MRPTSLYTALVNEGGKKASSLWVPSKFMPLIWNVILIVTVIALLLLIKM